MGGGRSYPDAAIAQHVQSKGQQVDDVLVGDVQRALAKLSDVAPALPWRTDAPHAMAAGHMTAVSLLQQVRSAECAVHCSVRTARPAIDCYLHLHRDDVRGHGLDLFWGHGLG